MFSRLVFSTAIAMALSSVVLGQVINPRPGGVAGQAMNQRRMQMAQQAQLQPIEIEGSIQGITHGRMMMVDDNNRAWQIAIPLGAKVHVTGTATRDHLQNGMFIEFEAEFDDRGELVEPVGALTIITPSQETAIGVSPVAAKSKDKDAAESAEPAEKETKGAHGAKRGKAAAAKPSLAGKYHIVGHLVVGRGNKLSVNAGNGTIPLELTEDPSVSININDYTVASEGDKAKLKGVMMTGQPGKAQATELTITLAEPLTAEKKKIAPAKSGAKHSTKRAKKDEGLPEMPADQ